MNNAPTNFCQARPDELTDEQWAAVGPLVPTPPRREDHRGRPWRDPREGLNGVLWVLRRSAHWRDLPAHFPPHQTCRRRFRQWLDDGTLRLVLEALAEDLHVRGGLDVTECLADEPFAEAGDEPGCAGAARVCPSWQQRTAALFLSPATRRLLRRAGSPLARRLP